MKYITIILLMIVTISFSQSRSFKAEQKRFSRVREAYTGKFDGVISLLEEKSIDISKLNIYLRAFKKEEVIELWGKNNSDSVFKLIKKYDICATSGDLGPKRKQGDYQVPEGFYYIDRFNPYSNFYLSLGLNYPNKSDRILGTKGKLGGDIFIHGNCVTIGCLPITDDKIKELYLFCVEAKNNGQNKIPVTIFPTELTDSKFAELKAKYSSDTDKIGLWADLKKGYDIFNET
ncbi:MAG: L,D-transpeptidase family protein, partial [Candidatus Delongbacteria bacterium]|nr:L,D-transpeptidase family protein [Candidatus Delongbacteria bacterium]